MRLFVAAELSCEMRSSLLSAAAQLKKLGKGNFTSPQNLHITLAFIGETLDIKGAISALKSIHSPSFDFALNGNVGHFGDLYYASVGNCPQMCRLAKEIGCSLREYGFKIDGRKFVPHITLVRKFVKNTDLPVQVTLDKTPMKLSHISLMKSERINGVLIYTCIFKKPLI